MSGAMAKAFEEARARNNRVIREEKPVSHTLEARGPSSSSGGSSRGSLSVEIEGKSHRYRITKVLRPTEWLNAMFERGEHERFCVIVEMTPELYQVMSKYNTHNRKPSPQKVGEIADAIVEEKYILTPDYFAFCHDKTLDNGQHRGRAVLYAGSSIPATVWFGCETDEFAVIDKGKRRLPSDVLYINELNFPSQRAWLSRIDLVIKHKNARGIFPDSMIEENAKHMAETYGDLVDKALDYGRQVHKWKPKLDAFGQTSSAYAFYYTHKLSHKEDSLLGSFFEGLKTGSSNKNIAELRAQLVDTKRWLVRANKDENDNEQYKVDTGWSRRDLNILVCAGIVQCWNRYSSLMAKERNHAPSRGFSTWTSINSLPQPN